MWLVKRKNTVDLWMVLYGLKIRSLICGDKVPIILIPSSFKLQSFSFLSFSHEDFLVLMAVISYSPF